MTSRLTIHRYLQHHHLQQKQLPCLLLLNFLHHLEPCEAPACELLRFIRIIGNLKNLTLEATVLAAPPSPLVRTMLGMVSGKGSYDPIFQEQIDIRGKFGSSEYVTCSITKNEKNWGQSRFDHSATLEKEDGHLTEVEVDEMPDGYVVVSTTFCSGFKIIMFLKLVQVHLVSWVT